VFITSRPGQINLVCVVLVASLVMSSGFGVAWSEEQPSAEQIIRALKPAKITRGITASPADAARQAEETHYVETLRKRANRSLTIDEREQVVAIVKKKPGVDLEINFEYDSAVIGSKAAPQVTALAQALASKELRDGTFLLAGHTDGKGNEGYNQALSERRAEAVKRFLTERYGMDASRLVTAGYGKTNLKNSADPFSAENRRVRVVNMSDK